MSLQGALAVLGLFSVPLWGAIAADQPAMAGTANMQVMAMPLAQLVPLALGMWLRARTPLLADRVQKISRRTADVLLMASTLYILATTTDQLAALPAAGWLTFALLSALCLATYDTRGLGTTAARLAVAMTTTIRNLSLAFLVVGLSPDPARATLTVLAYGLIMYAASALALSPLRKTASLRKDFAR